MTKKENVIQNLQGDFKLTPEGLINKINEFEVLNDTYSLYITYPKEQQYDDIISYCTKNNIHLRLSVSNIDDRYFSSTITFNGFIWWDSQDGLFYHSDLPRIDDHQFSSLNDLIDFIEEKLK